MKLLTRSKHLEDKEKKQKEILYHGAPRASRSSLIKIRTHHQTEKKLGERGSEERRAYGREDGFSHHSMLDCGCI